MTELAKEERVKVKELFISISFDEIAIRRHIQWVHSEKRFKGLVSFGRRNDEEIPVANNAIFFLVTLVNSGRSLILAYFLIKTLDRFEKLDLIKDVIATVNSTGCHLMSFAFDGLGTNYATFELLGAFFGKENFRPFIIDEQTNRRICLVLDRPHTIKLIRNCLAAKECLADGNQNKILWKHFVDLVHRKSNLVSHSMTNKYIEFHSNKMNVKLAAQTLSFSSANSMEFYGIAIAQWGSIILCSLCVCASN